MVSYHFSEYDCPKEGRSGDTKDSCDEELECVCEQFSAYHNEILLRDLNAEIRVTYNLEW
jgi:hypothetical protein